MVMLVRGPLVFQGQLKQEAAPSSFQAVRTKTLWPDL